MSALDVSADVTWESVADLGLAAGLEVDLVVKATEVVIHPW